MCRHAPAVPSQRHCSGAAVRRPAKSKPQLRHVTSSHSRKLKIGNEYGMRWPRARTRAGNGVLNRGACRLSAKFASRRRSATLECTLTAPVGWLLLIVARLLPIVARLLLVAARLLLIAARLLTIFGRLVLIVARLLPIVAWLLPIVARLLLVVAYHRSVVADRWLVVAGCRRLLSSRCPLRATQQQPAGKVGVFADIGLMEFTPVAARGRNWPRPFRARARSKAFSAGQMGACDGAAWGRLKAGRQIGQNAPGHRNHWSRTNTYGADLRVRFNALNQRRQYYVNYFPQKKQYNHDIS